MQRNLIKLFLVAASLVATSCDRSLKPEPPRPGASPEVIALVARDAREAADLRDPRRLNSILRNSPGLEGRLPDDAVIFVVEHDAVLRFKRGIVSKPCEPDCSGGGEGPFLGDFIRAFKSTAVVFADDLLPYGDCTCASEEDCARNCTCDGLIKTCPSATVLSN